MKDLHSHIMYGIDDGAKTKEESIALLTNAYQNGITDIVFTPHYIKDSIYNADNQEKTKILLQLEKELSARNININLYLGNEVYIDENLVSLYKEKYISTINHSRYILIELPLNTKFSLLDDVIQNLRENELIPIIAHPERYHTYYKDFDFFAQLLQKGCLLQGNIGSLYGKYGTKSKKMLKELLKRKMIHFLASDIHHYDANIYKKNINKDLLKIVKKDQIVDDLLINNFDKVINNEDINE